ncbi:MAG: thiosulfate/3-mercaptopyruvate sulfurtransferase, partial [Gaiellaceae bacterium]|nr:thiosulfate/3-mercaptopyruvate sulfurtransferase [Gaiellaceae bacterium]
SFLDVDRDLSSPPATPGGRHPLPAREDFEAAARRAGISNDTLVIAYDQDMNGGAARLWWLLRHYGHDACGVLDGGFSAWHGPLTRGDETGTPGDFTAAAERDDILDADALAARLGDPRLTILDARSPERFAGEPSPLDPRPGHIPGATSLFFRSREPIRPEIVDAPELVAYCGSGVTASVTLLRLAQAGRPDAKLYPGSWSDWAVRDLPIEG